MISLVVLSILCYSLRLNVRTPRDLPEPRYYSCNKEEGSLLLVVVCIVVYNSSIIFFIKNIIRINSEIIKYNYKPLQNPHYHIVDNAYYFNKKLKHYDEVRKKTDKRYYLILSIPFINANK